MMTINFRVFIFIFSCILLLACNKEGSTDHLPFIVFKPGNEFTRNGENIPVGGQMKFGITAASGSSVITYLRVQRITEDATITELDKGMYVETGGLDTTLIYVKGHAEIENWNFFIMNLNRDTASISLTVFRGEGSAYGDINYYPSIVIGYPGNQQFSHFLNLDSGIVYSASNIQGNEGNVDLAGFFYYTSGKASPTLTCPAYPSAITYYPEFNNWTQKNSTLYDYKSVDNDLISPEQFDSAENDSLLVAGYMPQNVSGLCKFCYTGKIVPFKTSHGKYGLVKVLRADEEENGSMEIAVKVQK